MSEAPIGSVEFLVKFDSIGQEFTKALTDAINDSDLDFDENFQEVISHIKRLYVTTGAADNYATFLGKIDNLKNWFSDEDNIKRFASNIIKSTATQRKLGVEGLPGVEMLEKSMEFSQQYFAKILQQIGQAEVAPAVWENIKGELGKTVALSEAIVQGPRVADFLEAAVKAIFKEDDVREGIADALESAGLTYAARVRQRPGLVYPGERAFPVAYAREGETTIGIEREKVITGHEQLQLLFRELGENISIEDIQEAWFEKLELADPSKFETALETIFEEYHIAPGTAVPRAIARVIQSVLGEEYFPALRKDSFEEITGRIRSEADRITRAPDFQIIIKGAADASKLLDMLGEDATGLKNLVDEAAKAGIEEFIYAPEAKLIGGFFKRELAQQDILTFIGAGMKGFVEQLDVQMEAEKIEAKEEFREEKRAEMLIKSLEAMITGLGIKITDDIRSFIDDIADKVH